MKIRDKIAFSFTFITAMLLMTVFTIIYFFTDRYTQSEFYLRLSQRGTIAAQTHLENDSSNINIYNEIRREHLKTLPNEKEIIVVASAPYHTIHTDSSAKPLPDWFFKELKEKEHAQIKIKDIYYYALLYHDETGDFIVLMVCEDLYGQLKMKNLRNTLWIIFIISLGMSYLLGRFYAKEIMMPISNITQRVNDISATNLHLRLDIKNKKDELGQLASTFNTMLDRLETSFEIQSNFISNASHELKNPLTAILGEIEISQNKERTADEYKTSLNKIEVEAARLDVLISSLLKLAQTEFDNKGLIIEPIRIDELLLSVKQNFNNIHPENNIVFDFSLLPENPDALIIQGNKSLLSIAFSNVLDNAGKFSGNQKVIIKIETTSKTVQITITDMGMGIPKDELKNIFEPFYRATNVRGVKGFGVGLPLTYRIVKLHSGQLQIDSDVEKGTVVKFSFPNQEQHITILR